MMNNYEKIDLKKQWEESRGENLTLWVHVQGVLMFSLSFRDKVDRE